MDRLNQLIHNICESRWNISLVIEYSKYSENLKIEFKRNDHAMLRKFVDAGLIEPWELYGHWIDILLSIGELNDKWSDHPALDYTSYFPENGEKPEKAIPGGNWIRIPTPTGYRIFHAKPSTRKIDYERRLATIRRSTAQMKKMSLKRLGQAGDDLDEGMLLLCQQNINIDPFYISYQATKSKKEFLLPYQYDVINDLDIYLNINSKRIKFVAFYEEDIRDKVFYLQTRGIDKATATTMVARSQGYFDVDLIGMINDEREANGLEHWPKEATISF